MDRSALVLGLMIWTARLLSGQQSASIPNSCSDTMKGESGATNRVVAMFHYTNEKGKAGICKDMYIKKSIKTSDVPDDDARFGNGVYFTDLNPTKSNYTLLKNNYNNESNVNEGNLRYFFNCTFHRRDLCHSSKAQEKNRSIWIHECNVYLDQKNCKLGSRQDGGKSVKPESCSGAMPLPSPQPGLWLACVLLLRLWALG